MVENKVDPVDLISHVKAGRLSARLLWLDGVINIILGALLIPFPSRVVEILGVPQAENPFYPSILGAVFVGVGLGLVMEARRRPGGPVGLGLGGAMAINLCGGGALAAWLLSGRLGLPLRGALFLWGLVAVLFGLSFLEWRIDRQANASAAAGKAS